MDIKFHHVSDLNGKDIKHSVESNFNVTESSTVRYYWEYINGIYALFKTVFDNYGITFCFDASRFPALLSNYYNSIKVFFYTY